MASGTKHILGDSELELLPTVDDLKNLPGEEEESVKATPEKADPDATTETRWETVLTVHYQRSLDSPDDFRTVWSGKMQIALHPDTVITFEVDDIDRIHPLAPGMPGWKRKKLFKDRKSHRRQVVEEEVQQRKKQGIQDKIAALQAKLASLEKK